MYSLVSNIFRVLFIMLNIGRFVDTCCSLNNSPIAASSVARELACVASTICITSLLIRATSFEHVRVEDECVR
jgi:hypothetical protein